MALLMTAALFLILATFITLVGMKMWMRPKEALDRVAAVPQVGAEQAPVHPSLLFRDMLKRLGNLLPASPKDVTIMQRRLIRAGIRDHNALKYLYGAKVFFGVALPALTAIYVAGSEGDPTNKVMMMIGAGALGFLGPNEVVNIKGRRRQKQLKRGLPNALDLMVVCVESGLGLDQAILQVAKELEHAHPEITEEFSMVNLELKAGKRRVEALRNLSERVAVDDLKKLVAVLIQADRFGTGIAQSLRAHADFMRVQARQIAEEKAAKLGVKLVFPIFFCILPSLFVITVAPMIVKIMREVLPMLQNM